MKDRFLNILFSTRLTALFFILYPTAMAFGTFIESWYSTDTAKILIYNAWWFELIMVLMAINFFGNIFRYRLYKKEKWAVLLLHFSFFLRLILISYLSCKTLLSLSFWGAVIVLVWYRMYRLPYLLLFVEEQFTRASSRAYVAVPSDLITVLCVSQHILPTKRYTNTTLFSNSTLATQL